MLVERLERVALLFGSNWVMYLLIGLSVWSIGIVLERILYFRANRDDIDKLGRGLLARLRADDRRGADELLAKSKSIEARIVRAVLAWLDGGPDAVQEAIHAELRRHKGELERGMTVMGTLGNNAPFVGLLGTVLGVIAAFHQLGQTQNKAAMGNVMVGIAEALIATGVGLVVALPAVVAYNVMARRAAEVENNVMILAGQLLAFLKAKAHTPSDRAAIGEPTPALPKVGHSRPHSEVHGKASTELV